MSRSAKVGIFVSITAILVIASHFWLTQFRVRREGYSVAVIFPDVTGLKERDPVRVFGVEKGSVQDIQFKGDHIEVTLWLDADVILYRDARASINDVAMISGTKYVELDPGSSGEPFGKFDVVEGAASHGIPYAEIASTLERLISSVNIEGVTSTLSSIETATEELKGLMSRMEKDVEVAMSDVKSSARSITSLSRALEQTSGQIDGILNDIREGEGTLGRLIVDDSLYIELEKTLKATRALVEDIKEDPKRYLSIF